MPKTGVLTQRRDLQMVDLRRHENGCAVRGCSLASAYKRPVTVREDLGPTGGLARLVVLGYCANHLDQILAFKERAAA